MLLQSLGSMGKFVDPRRLSQPLLRQCLLCEAHDIKLILHRSITVVEK